MLIFRELHRRLRRLYWAFIWLLLSFAFGVSGFMIIEKYNFLDALYMCVITLATVGYGEVKPLNDAGKIFTIVYILFNLALLTFVISVLTAYFFEGGLKKVFQRYKTQKIIGKMKNHIIVCGYGRTGKNVCQELDQLQVPYILVEKAPTHLQHFEATQDREVVIGDASLEDTLLQANIATAKALIITLSDDADSVFITLTARELNSHIFIVARISEPNSIRKVYKAGANKVVLPEALGGVQMAHLVEKPHIVEFLDHINELDKFQLALEEVAYEDMKEQYKDKPLKEFKSNDEYHAAIIAIKDAKKGFILNPPNSTVISEGKILILLGSHKVIEQFKTEYLEEHKA